VGTVAYNQLARYPDLYVGKEVEFTGRVLQVIEGESQIQIRIATKKDGLGKYNDDIVYLFFDRSLISARILDDDIIRISGIANGLHSYKTVLGSKITLPLIEVTRITLK
jgi:hypothetical protein